MAKAKKQKEGLSTQSLIICAAMALLIAASVIFSNGEGDPAVKKLPKKQPKELAKDKPKDIEAEAKSKFVIDPNVPHLQNSIQAMRAGDYDAAEAAYFSAKSAGLTEADTALLLQLAEYKSTVDGKDDYLREDPTLPLAHCAQLGSLEDSACYSPGVADLFTDIWTLENTNECSAACEQVCQVAKSFAGQGLFAHSAKALRRLVEINSKVLKPRHIFGALLPWGMYAKDRFKSLPDKEQKMIFDVLTEMVDDKDEEWGHLARLNLASAHYCLQTDKDSEAAKAVLQQLIGDLPAAVMADPAPPLGKLHVITVATSERKELDDLRQSAKRSDVELKVLGMGRKWEGMQMKVQLWREYLETVPDNDLVVAIDGYDTLMFSSMSSITTTFMKFKRDIIFGAESNCFPDPAFKLFYHKNGNRMHRFQYLNAGTWIGRAKAVRDMLTEITTRFPNVLYDDQRALGLYHFRNPATTALDHTAEIFLTLHGCQVDAKTGQEDTSNCKNWYIIQNNVFMSKIYNNQVHELKNGNVFDKGTVPAVIHGNGPVGKKALVLVLESIKESQEEARKRKEYIKNHKEAESAGGESDSLYGEL